MITGTHTYDSILLRLLGYPHGPPPGSESLGGLGLGKPLSPSNEATRAVDSPHTKAPAPSLILISKLKSVLRILLPSSPISFACSMAMLRFLTARGYSCLTYIIPYCAPIEYAQRAIPSRRLCGSPSMIDLSMNAPGSPSSPLAMTNLISPGADLTCFHFLPAGNPAPPLPRRLALSTSSRTSSGVIESSALASAA